MVALLLAVSLSSVAPDPQQTPAALLARRLAAPDILNFDGPLASQALSQAPFVRVCATGVPPLGANLWSAGAALARSLATPQCGGMPNAFGSDDSLRRAASVELPLRMGAPQARGLAPGLAVHLPAAWFGSTFAAPARTVGSPGGQSVRVLHAPAAHH